MSKLVYFLSCSQCQPLELLRHVLDPGLLPDRRHLGGGQPLGPMDCHGYVADLAKETTHITSSSPEDVERDQLLLVEPDHGGHPHGHPQLHLFLHLHEGQVK